MSWSSLVLPSKKRGSRDGFIVGHGGQWPPKFKKKKILYIYILILPDSINLHLIKNFMDLI